MADVDDLRDRSDRWQRCIEAPDLHGVAECHGRCQHSSASGRACGVDLLGHRARGERWEIADALEISPAFQVHEVQDTEHEVQNEFSNIVNRTVVGGAAKAMSSFSTGRN